MTVNMKMLLISNMYPNKANPGYGVFVKNFCESVENFNIEIKKIVMYKNNCKFRFIKLLSYIIYYIKIIVYLLFNNYDIIYIHYGSLNAPPVLLINKLKKLNIYTNLHGSDVESNSFINNLLQKYQNMLLNISHKIIVPSNSFKEIIIRKYNIDVEKIAVYPSGGIDRRIFYKKNLQYLITNNIRIQKDMNTYYFGFVGRLEKFKGWETFIDAIDYIINELKVKNIMFIVVGDGKDFLNMKLKIKKCSIEDNIIHLNNIYHKELSNVYNFIDVLVFPSFRESLGLVPLEALACGTPVIASSIPVTNEYIEDGLNGFIFEKGNCKDLAKKIINYINLSNVTKNLFAEQSKEKAKRYYRENIEDSLEKIIYS